MKAVDYGVKAIGVRSLPTEKLKANPGNLQDALRSSRMQRVAPRVDRACWDPCSPHRLSRKKSTGHFVILDGQRRWICAQDVGLKTIPVNEVAEPTLVQNIVTMFQIHKLRKDWELMPTALKLELLMRELSERRKSVSRN